MHLTTVRWQGYEYALPETCRLSHGKAVPPMLGNALACEACPYMRLCDAVCCRLLATLKRERPEAWRILTDWTMADA